MAQPENYIEHFLTKCNDFDELITKHQKIYFWVIDMQNDFIDLSFADASLFSNSELADCISVSKEEKLLLKPTKKLETRKDWTMQELPSNIIEKGRFAVDEGSQCITDIQHYLDKLSVSDKLQKVIFSRDIHTESIKEPNHCSFQITPDKGTIDGVGFPAHCVNGTMGCKLNNKIEDMCTQLNPSKDDKKAIVVMKGCNQNTDSFGAYPYSCSNDAKMYTNLRQHNGCRKSCTKENIMNGFLTETGSVILNDTEKFAETIEKDPSRLSITTLFENNGAGQGDLHLISGLAGDYCVRDTAINLKFAFPQSTVAVIADAVRYPALPEGAIGVMPPDNTPPQQIESILAIKRMELERDLHLKSFIEPNAGNKYFITPADVLLFTYSSKLFPKDNEGVVFTIDEQNKSRLLDLSPTVQANGNDRPSRNIHNNYWCLARYMHLMGKQLVPSNDKEYYRDFSSITNSTIGEDKVSTQMKLDGFAKDDRKDGDLMRQLTQVNSTGLKILGGKKKKSKTNKKSKKSKKSYTKKRTNKYKK